MGTSTSPTQNAPHPDGPIPVAGNVTPVAGGWTSTEGGGTGASPINATVDDGVLAVVGVVTTVLVDERALELGEGCEEDGAVVLAGEVVGADVETPDVGVVVLVLGGATVVEVAVVEVVVGVDVDVGVVVDGVTSVVVVDATVDVVVVVEVVVAGWQAACSPVNVRSYRVRLPDTRFASTATVQACGSVCDHGNRRVNDPPKSKLWACPSTVTVTRLFEALPSYWVRVTDRPVQESTTCGVCADASPAGMQHAKPTATTAPNRKRLTTPPACPCGRSAPTTPRLRHEYVRRRCRRAPATRGPPPSGER